MSIDFSSLFFKQERARLGVNKSHLSFLPVRVKRGFDVDCEQTTDITGLFGIKTHPGCLETGQRERGSISFYSQPQVRIVISVMSMQNLNLNITLQGNQMHSSHSLIHQWIWISQLIWPQKQNVLVGAHFKFVGYIMLTVPRTQLPNNEIKLVLQNHHVDDFSEFRDPCRRSRCKDHSSSVVESVVNDIL